MKTFQKAISFLFFIFLLLHINLYANNTKRNVLKKNAFLKINNRLLEESSSDDSESGDSEESGGSGGSGDSGESGDSESESESGIQTDTSTYNGTNSTIPVQSSFYPSTYTSNSSST